MFYHQDDVYRGAPVADGISGSVSPHGRIKEFAQLVQRRYDELRVDLSENSRTTPDGLALSFGPLEYYE